MFLHAACCDLRFSSAGACKYIPWEVHIVISVSLVVGRGKNKAGGSAALMDLLTCVGSGRLLTMSLRTLDFYGPFMC